MSFPLRAGGVLAVAGIGVDSATGKDPTQAVVSGGLGFGASVVMGAAVGSLIPVPGIGTAIGALVGAGVGIFTSGMVDSLFEEGVDVQDAAADGFEAVWDTGSAVVGGVSDGVDSLASTVGGWFD